MFFKWYSKGESKVDLSTAPPTKNLHVCALSQINQQLFEKIDYASHKKLFNFKEHKNGIEILVG